MAGFVEQATLKVNDQASAQINKINAELKKLFATANSLKSTKIDFKINDAGLLKAVRDIGLLRKEVNQIRSSSINLRVNTGGLSAAQQQIARLRSQAQRPITTTVRGAAGRYGSGAIPGLRGFGMGFGMGLGGLIGSLNAVELAGYAAAAALRSIADNAAKRDRTNLQSAALASDEQRKVFEQQDRKRAEAESEYKNLPEEEKTRRKEAAKRWEETPEAKRVGEKPFVPAPLKLTKNDYDRLRVSLLGDVQPPKGLEQAKGDTEAQAAAKRVKRDEYRAEAAAVVAEKLEKDILPRIYAQAPEKGYEGAQEGLRKLIQAVNLASIDIVEGSTGAVKMSADGLRVLKGIQIAMAADPNLEPSLIKTSLANLKTAGYSLSSDAIARVLVNVGARGQRAANETFRAIKAASGVVDVKKFNKQLIDMGLIEGAKFEKGKKGKQGKYIPGSGRPVGGDMLLRDPQKWYATYFKTALEEKANTKAGIAARQKAENERAKRVQAGEEEGDPKARKIGPVLKEGTPGKTKEEIEQSQLTPTDIIALINSSFSGVAAAASQGAADLILGFKTMNSAIEQANTGLKQDIPESIAASWVAQAENVGNAFKDAAAAAGDAFAKAINLASILEMVAGQIKDSPVIATALAGLGAALTLAVGTAMARALLLPMGALDASAAAIGVSSGALDVSAAALSGAAGALTEAAVALGAKGLIPPGGTPPGGAPGAPKGVPGGVPGGAAETGVGGLLRRLGPGVLRWGLRLGVVGGVLLDPTEISPGGESQKNLEQLTRETQRLQAAQKELQGTQDPAEIKRLTGIINDARAQAEAARDRIFTPSEPKPPEKPSAEMTVKEINEKRERDLRAKRAIPLTEAPPWLEDMKLIMREIPAIKWPEPPLAPLDVKPQPTPEPKPLTDWQKEIQRLQQEPIRMELPPIDIPMQEVPVPPWLEDMRRIMQEVPATKWPETPMKEGTLPTPIGDTGEPILTAANTFMSAAGTLSTSSGMFASVFSTGAAEIGASGSIAASTIAAGAASAGAIYGAAAASAISAATANINVNVNANVTGGKGAGVDTGTLSKTGG